MYCLHNNSFSATNFALPEERNRIQDQLSTHTTLFADIYNEAVEWSFETDVTFGFVCKIATCSSRFQDILQVKRFTVVCDCKQNTRRKEQVYPVSIEVYGRCIS